ncbi:farnesol dehydrogenase-like [Aethina tumida]|uniref:farnesol dehydrogenase-like n=1 Tax=Aethina tumida TaxID=116153 RepID=UPI0021479732|nr:farnesol dehydrogenase-like [Aethina tumida]
MAGFERWVGKVAVITGASSGIGADIAKQLVQKGLKVVGLARRKERVEELNKSLSGASGKLYALKCDVSKEEDIKNAFKWTSDNVGPVHILVNNAGFLNNNTLIDGDAEMWRQTFDVNVIGLLTATREAVNIMRANNIDGHIINLNSVAGHYDIYFPKVNVYPATKHAVTNLTETLRKEFNDNKLKIKVTSVSPGAVRTEFIEASKIDFGDVMKYVPFLEPDDVTEAIIYALSTKPHVQIHEILIYPMGSH